MLGGAANTCGGNTLGFDYSSLRVLSAEWLKRIHGFFTLLWIALWIIAIPTGWIHSVIFVSHMSMAALVYTSVSAWQGSRTEVKQNIDLKE